MAEDRGTAQRVEGIFMGLAIAAIIGIGGWLVLAELTKQPMQVPALEREKTPEQWIAHRNTVSFATGLKKLWGLALEPGGTVLACGEGGLKRFDRTGKELGALIADRTVRAVALRKAGGLYALAGSSVLLLDAAGTQTAEWKPWPADGPEPTLAAVEEAGEHVFVAEIDPRGGKKTGQIHRLSLTGEHQLAFGHRDSAGKDSLNIPGPYLDLAWRDDRLYVTNPGRHRVHVYDRDGNLVQTAGVPSWSGVGFSGCCNPVTVAVLGGGIFVTAEKGLPRIKRMSEAEGLLGYVVPQEDFGPGGFGIDLAADAEGTVWVADHGRQQVMAYAVKAGWSKPEGRPEDEEDIEEQP
jgi:hypothetical protein